MTSHSVFEGVRHMIRPALPAVVLALVFLSATGPLAAQSGEPGIAWDPEGLQMNRAELETLLEELEDVQESPAYSDRLRERARTDADLIRDRLSMGDLRVGDRVLLQVEGEPQLPDTLAVEPGPAVTLPVLGRIPLRGVLRSELEDHLEEELGTFIRDPVVRAQALIRLSIQGNVGSPGFYTVPADMLVGEALMLAGGPTQSSDLDDVEIQRGERVLWSGDEIRDAMVDGRTLDQLNLRGGDQVRVPVQPQNPWWRTALNWSIPVATSLFLGVRVFGGF